MTLIFQDPEKSRSCSVEALALAECIGDKRWTAMSLLHLGCIAANSRKNAQAKTYFSRALKIFRTISDSWGIANTLRVHGFSLLETPRGLKRGVEMLNESIELSEAVGDLANLAWLYQHLAWASMMQEKYQDAIAWIRKSFFYAEKVNQTIVIENREILGTILGAMGQYSESINRLVDAMMTWLDQGRLISVVHCIEQLAISFIGWGMLGAAARLMGAAAVLYNKLPQGFKTPIAANFDKYVRSAKAELGGPAFGKQYEAGKTMTVPQVKDLCNVPMDQLGRYCSLP